MQMDSRARARASDMSFESLSLLECKKEKYFPFNFHFNWNCFSLSPSLTLCLTDCEREKRFHPFKWALNHLPFSRHTTDTHSHSRSLSLSLSVTRFSGEGDFEVYLISCWHSQVTNKLDNKRRECEVISAPLIHLKGETRDLFNWFCSFTHRQSTNNDTLRYMTRSL